MGMWTRLLKLLGIRPAGKRRRYDMEEPLQLTLGRLAKREQAEVIEAGLAHLQSRQRHDRQWLKLSAREQEVAALTCLGYTNEQMAARLKLSPDTVKTHVRNALTKFNLHSKAELRQALSGWNFSDWEEKRDRRSG